MVRALSPLQAHALLAFKDALLNMSKSTIECAVIVTRSSFRILQHKGCFS